MGRRMMAVGHLSDRANCAMRTVWEGGGFMSRATLRTGALRQAALLVVAGCLALGAPVAASAQASGMGMMDFEAARDSFFSQADRDGDFALSDDELMNAIG